MDWVTSTNIIVELLESITSYEIIGILLGTPASLTMTYLYGIHDSNVNDVLVFKDHAIYILSHIPTMYILVISVCQVISPPNLRTTTAISPSTVGDL